MDINNINPINQNLLKSIKEANAKKTTENKDLQVQNKESVYGITGESRKYIELSNKIPEIRYDLVEKLKEEIKNGTYQINVDRIVNKMLE